MGEIITRMDARARERRARMATRRFASNAEADDAGGDLDIWIAMAMASPHLLIPD